MHYAIWVCMHKSLCTKSVTASGHALRRFMHYNRMHYENFDCTYYMRHQCWQLIDAQNSVHLPKGENLQAAALQQLLHHVK